LPEESKRILTPKPPNPNWNQWRRVLDNSFLSNRDARGLKEVLLDWHDGTQRNWKWYFCSAEDHLYAKEGLRYGEFIADIEAAQAHDKEGPHT
jgi:hypothetical protein